MDWRWGRNCGDWKSRLALKGTGVIELQGQGGWKLVYTKVLEEKGIIMSDENITQIRTGRTRDSLRRAIQAELADTRLKEVKGKLKKLVEELAAANAVVTAKEAEISNLFEDYADVLPE